MCVPCLICFLIVTLMEALRENPREVRMVKSSSFGLNAPSEAVSIIAVLLCS